MSFHNTHYCTRFALTWPGRHRHAAVVVGQLGTCKKSNKAETWCGQKQGAMLAVGTGLALIQNSFGRSRGLGRAKAPPRFRSLSFRMPGEIGRGLKGLRTSFFVECTSSFFSGAETHLVLGCGKLHPLPDGTKTTFSGPPWRCQYITMSAGISGVRFGHHLPSPPRPGSLR